MITKEEFENMIEIEPYTKLRSGVPAQVYRFLLKNKGNAFTSGEILKQVHVKHNQICEALKSLHRKGFIKNNRPYWIIETNKINFKYLDKK